MLVCTEQLASELGDPGLVIVDARPHAAYAESHIPGAINLDLFAFHWADTTDEGIRGFGRQAARLLSFAGAYGRRVVFYDDVSGMLAARGVWLSVYMSHPDATMLNGGMKKWKAEGRPVESGTNPSRPVPYTGSPNPRIIAGYEHVRDNIGHTHMIDTRAAPEYEGTVARAAHAGHIPDAINVDWIHNILPDGTFKAPYELSEIYGEDREVITYCHGAYRAANTYVALSIAGFKNIRVYLGSWGEWGNLDLPASRD